MGIAALRSNRRKGRKPLLWVKLQAYEFIIGRSGQCIGFCRIGGRKRSERGWVRIGRRAVEFRERRAWRA